MTIAGKKKKRAPTGDYEVGYARPPAETRFQKGESGNPKGRPRKSRNKLTMVKEAIKRTLAEIVPVRIGSEVREMPMAEALGVSAVTRAAKSGKDLQLLLRLNDFLGITAEENLISELEQSERGEEAVLEVVELLLQRGRVVVDPKTKSVGWASEEMRPSYQARMNLERAARQRKVPR